MDYGGCPGLRITSQEGFNRSTRIPAMKLFLSFSVVQSVPLTPFNGILKASDNIFVPKKVGAAELGQDPYVPI